MTNRHIGSRRTATMRVGEVLASEPLYGVRFLRVTTWIEVTV